MIVNNKYTRPLQLAIRDEDQEAVEELIIKWREENNLILLELDKQLKNIIDNKTFLEEQHKLLSVSKQYKKSCQLYRDCRDLLLSIRNFKKSLREELKC